MTTFGGFLRRFPVNTAAVAVLLALIALSIPLRLRSARELSDVQLERTQTRLQEATRGFAQDFDREITRAVIYFAISPTASTKGIPGQLVDRFEHWLEHSPHPTLVSGLFFQPGERLEAKGLLSLDPSRGELESVDWPERFNSMIEPPERSLDARDEPGAAFQDQVPALVLPLVSESGARTGKPGGDEVEVSLDGHVIIELDSHYIVEEFLPELVERHLSIGDAVEYEALILRRTNPPQIIYQTGASFSPGEREEPDATAYLFDLLSQQRYRELLLNVGLSLGMLMPESQQAREELAAAQVPASVLSEGERDFGRWQILVRHPAGSLQSAFDTQRRRAVAVNLGLFVLLGSMAVLLVVSSQRAHRLASQRLEFVAGVSHELRTPLSVIRMAAGNLERGTVRDVESVRRYASLIGKEERRLSEMVERVLAFGQMQRKETAFARETVSATGIVEAAVDDCQLLIEQSEATIERNEPDEAISVQGDARALRHAVQNLLANAIKHASPDPRVRIDTAISTSNGSREVTIQVADNGPGIPDRDLPHVFEPFYRGKRALSDQVQGSGLGLTLVKEIVESHQGRVTAESSETGSVFTIRLPASGGA